MLRLAYFRLHLSRWIMFWATPGMPGRTTKIICGTGHTSMSRIVVTVRTRVVATITYLEMNERARASRLERSWRRNRGSSIADTCVQ